MSKNYVILNGSPRKNGNVAQMLRIIADELRNLGNNVDWVDAGDLTFAPCRGCMKCRETRQCVMPQDDAHRVARLIEHCDGLVMGSPVYWGNMSGQLKLLLDRMVPAFIGESKSGIPRPLHKGKTCALVTACSTSAFFDLFAGETRRIFSTMNEITHYSGFKAPCKLRLTSSKGIAQPTPKVAKNAIKIAHRL